MGMNKYKKRNFILTALSLFFMSCVIFGCTLLNTVTADALKDITSSTVSPIYNFEDYCYNKSALDELANQILTVQAPTYSKNINGLISYASSAGRPGKPISNKDISVKYGRYRFSPTSVTYNDLVWLPVYISTNANGEAILTLYLAGTETNRNTSQQEQGYFTPQGLYSADPNIFGPSNSYGTSHMRSISLGASTYDETDKEYKTAPYATYAGGNYKLKEDAAITQANCNKFSDFIGGKDFVGVLYEDLATPSEMSWQASESFKTHSSSFITNGMPGSYENYCWPNEAYGTPAAGEYYLPGYFNYAQKNKTNYNAWQTDKVWLPSLTEVGNGNVNEYNADTTNGIWKLTAYQRSNKQKSWLRTAKTDTNKTNNYSAYTMFCLDTEGGITESDVNQQCAIRPAIHVNLNKISGKTIPAVKLPDVVTSIYNGNPLGQTMADVPADQKKWYTEGDMTIEFYLDKDCTRGIAPVDAGTYYMLVRLTNSSNRYFFGEPANTEWKSTVFVIQKKKLEVKWTYNDDATVKSVEYAAGTEFYERDKDNIPKLGFYYKSIMNAADIYYSYPDMMGSYRAWAYIVNENMFKYNYELVDSARSEQFTVGKRILPLPEFCYSEGTSDVISADHRTLSMSYKGKNFVQIKNISSKMKITVSANSKSALAKLVDLGLNEETGIQTYMVEDVARYTFTVQLTDKEKANAHWEGVGEDTGDKNLILSIDRAQITATFDGLLSSWDTLTDMSFQIGIVGVQAGDSVAMRVYYVPARGGNETVLTPDSNGKYTIPKGRNVGEYTIGAVIDHTAQGANGCYEMKQAYTQKFTITQASSSFGQDLVTWQYTVGGAVTRLNDIGAGNTAGNAVELDFKDDYYQFTLQMEEGRLQQYYYVKAEYSGDNYVKDAGLHSVTVTISAYDHNVSFDTQTYVVYFKIKKTTFNMSGVSWNYPGAYQQMPGREHEVLLKNVPDGLTVNYSGNKASDAGNYSAEAEFVVSDDYATNYEAPANMTFAWAIVESGGYVPSKIDYDTSTVRLLYIHGSNTIVCTWDSEQKKWFDSNGKEFVLTFTYDGLEHVLDMEGGDGNFTIGTNHVNNKYTNAGNYTARFDYTGNSAIYNDLEFATLGWTIAKAEINFDNVRWGYIVGENEYDIDFEVNPFTFTRDENGPVKFTVGLLNLPEGITVNYSTTCLTKPGSAAVRGNSFSETGDYRTSFTRAISFTDPNYVSVNSIPTFIPSFQYWSIEDRKFTKPSYDGSWDEFDARPHDLIDLCSMPRDELLYFRVEVAFLDGGNNVYSYYEGYEGVPYTGYHAGTYIVRFYELRGDEGTEYPWGSVEIVVGKEKLQVVWDHKGSIPVARVTGLYVTEMIGTKYTTDREEDKEGNNEVSDQYIKSTDGATFYARPYLTPEYVNDIEIVMGSDQESPLEFTYWFYQSTPSSLAIPKEDIKLRPATKEFNGTAQTFEFAPEWNDYTSYLYYEGDSLTQTAVGKYSIDVSFIKFDSVTKAGDAYWAGTEDDRSSIKLTFEITAPTKIALDYPKLESSSATYDGNFHKISIVNLAAMNSYITYEVTYEGMNFGQQLAHKAAGNYTITFSFPEGSIGEWKNAPDEASKKKSYTLTYRIIDPASSTPLTVPKLVNNSMEATGGPITFDILNWDSYYNGYCEITEGSLTQTAVGTYTVTVSIKDDFPDLKFTNGARWYILTFTITEGEKPARPTQLALPVVSDPVREYTGAEMSFIDNWGDLSPYVIIVGLDGGLIGQGSYIQEELGEYSFYLRIKDDYKDIPWADGSTDDKLVTFSIVPAIIDTTKLGAGTDGKVTAPNKDGRDVDFDDYFDYKYFDKDGKEVSADELVDGEEYTVTVSLKNDPAIQKKFNDSFENADEIRQALTTNNSFTFTYDSGEDDNKMLLIIIIAEVAVVVFLMIATGVVLAIQHKVYDTVDDEYDSYEDYEEDD